MNKDSKNIKNLSSKEQVEQLLKGVDILLKKASEKNDNKEDLQKASLYLIKCLQIDPKCIKAYLHLANIFKQSKKYDESINLLINVLDLDKNNKVAQDLLIDMKSHIIEKLNKSKNSDLKNKLTSLKKDLNSSIGSANVFNFNKK